MRQVYITDLAVCFLNSLTPTLPIDIVYLWVNGTDEKWKKEYLWWRHVEDSAMESFEENYRFAEQNELLYSLRSISKNAPWIRNIYIVTNGQIPAWLDCTNKKLHFITHDQIMPSWAYPTYNSEAIESCLAQIPGLSEFFLYANDDTFISRPVTPLFFFSLFGKPKYRVWINDLRKINWNNCLYTRTLMFNSRLFDMFYGTHYYFMVSHNICPYRKTHYIETTRIFRFYFNKTVSSRFRSSDCAHRTLVTYLSYMTGQSMVLMNHNKRRGTHVYTRIVSPEVLKGMINKLHPKLLCINDDENVTPTHRNQLETFLQSIFPVQSAFEFIASKTS